jgi:hypothetical protein
VQTLLFDTLHVFFVIQHINREVLHVAVTRHPTAEWLAQQILESCAWDRRPPGFMIHDRDTRYDPNFDRRLKRLGIKQVRTLGEIGFRLGRRALSEVATAAQPDTILAWYQRLVACKFDGSPARRVTGRQRWPWAAGILSSLGAADQRP